jgi:hypothetical protein
MARDPGCPKDQIMAEHFVENFVNIFFTPTLDVHINEAGVHKDIRFTTILQDLCMNVFAFLQYSQFYTCFEHWNKTKGIWSHELSFHLLEKPNGLLPLSKFHTHSKLGIQCSFVHSLEPWSQTSLTPNKDCVCSLAKVGVMFSCVG